IRDQLGCLGAFGGHVGLPLRDRSSVLEFPATRGGIAAQLARHRSGIAADGASDLAYALVLRAEQRDLLTLSKRKVAACWLRSDEQTAALPSLMRNSYAV